MFRRLCVALLLVLPIGLSMGQAAAACLTETDIIASISIEAPDADIRSVDGAAAERITAGISALTGSEVAAGGSYVLVDVPETALTYVVRLAGGCATHHGRFPRQLVRGWVHGQLAERRP